MLSSGFEQKEEKHLKITNKLKIYVEKQKEKQKIYKYQIKIGYRIANICQKCTARGSEELPVATAHGAQYS